MTFAELDALHNDNLAALYGALQSLWHQRLISVTDRAVDPHFSVTATVDGDPLRLGVCSAAEGRWKLSRFAFLRMTEQGSMRIETPLSLVVAAVLKPAAGAVFTSLAQPSTAGELAERTGVTSSEAAMMLKVLHLARVIEPTDEAGTITEERREDLLQWEFHDLLFHNRSRMGRHSEQMGGQFRFRGRIAPQPVVKHNPWIDRAIPLAKADLNVLAAADPPFTTVLESRESIREQDASRPIDLPQLGEFLFRAARIRDCFNTSMGEFSSRPYPGGGAAHELELYVTVNACAGLMRGFYYYDPLRHALCPVCAPDDEVEALLDDAWVSAGQLCRPQVLITVASRFQRVSWKYSGIAYATQLKNVGVLYQTFYLVATAMGLAGCALGLGNSERQRKLAGASYFEESSIGEFMLGSRERG